MAFTECLCSVLTNMGAVLPLPSFIIFIRIFVQMMKNDWGFSIVFRKEVMYDSDLRLQDKSELFQ